MKTISPKVQALLDQISEMDAVELKEFRILLAKQFGLTSYTPDADEDGDTPAGAAVPKVPISPSLIGSERNLS